MSPLTPARNNVCDLLRRNGHEWLGGYYGSANGREWPWRRGFVESVTCTAADWLQYGDEIRRQHPVTRVKLTELFHPAMLPDSFWREPFTDWTKLQEVFDEYTYLVDPATGEPIYTPDSVIWADAFSRRWPGVEFELAGSDAPIGVYTPIDWTAATT